MQDPKNPLYKHAILEKNAFKFTVWITIAVAIGGLVEMVPMFNLKQGGQPSSAEAQAAVLVKPRTPLQLEGFDIYVREGCYTCHSQMVRPLVTETMRYGAYSREQESMYDRPFQWGSKRTGPDLARLGGKYPDLWHYRHMLDPREVSPGSIMPAYPWLFKDKTDFGVIGRKLGVLKALGTPYTDDEVRNAVESAKLEASLIGQGLQAQGAPAGIEDKEIVALIAYLQRMGQDFKKGLIQ